MIEKNEDYWSARALREYQYKGKNYIRFKLNERE